MPAALKQSNGMTVSDVGRVWLELPGDLVMRDRFVDQPHSVEQIAEIEMRAAVVRSNAQRRIEMRSSLFSTTCHRQRQPESIFGFRVLRPGPESGLEVANRLLRVSKPYASESQVVARFREVWADRQGRFVVLRRLLPRAGVRQHCPEIVVSLGMTGIDFDCAPEMRNGLPAAPESPQKIAEVVVGGGIATSGFQAPLVESGGLAEATELLMSGGQSEQQIVAGRAHAQTTLEQLDRGDGVALVQKDQPEVERAEPACRVLRERHAIKSLLVAIHPGLTEGEDGQDHEQQGCCRASQRAWPRLRQDRQSTRDSGDDPHRGEILKVIGDERVAKWIDIDEAQRRNEGTDEQKRDRQRRSGALPE